MLYNGHIHEIIMLFLSTFQSLSKFYKLHVKYFHENLEAVPKPPDTNLKRGSHDPKELRKIPVFLQFALHCCVPEDLSTDQPFSQSV